MKNGKKFKIFILGVLFAFISFFSLSLSVSADNLNKTLYGYYYLDYSTPLLDLQSGPDSVEVRFKFYTALQMYINEYEGTDNYFVGIGYVIDDGFDHFNSWYYINENEVKTYWTYDNTDKNKNYWWTTIYVPSEVNITDSTFIDYFNNTPELSLSCGGYYMFFNNGQNFNIDFNSLYSSLGTMMNQVSEYGMNDQVYVDLHGTFVNGIKYDDIYYYNFKAMIIDGPNNQIYLRTTNDVDVPLLDYDYVNGEFYVMFDYKQYTSKYVVEWLEVNGTFSEVPVQNLKVYGIGDLANTIVSIPVNYLSSFMDFSLFGTSLFVVFCSLITLMLAIWVIKHLR